MVVFYVCSIDKYIPDIITMSDREEVKPRPSLNPDPAGPGSNSLCAVSTGILKVSAWVIEESVYVQAST